MRALSWMNLHFSAVQRSLMIFAKGVLRLCLRIRNSLYHPLPFCNNALPHNILYTAVCLPDLHPPSQYFQVLHREGLPQNYQNNIWAMLKIFFFSEIHLLYQVHKLSLIHLLYQRSPVWNVQSYHTYKVTKVHSSYFFHNIFLLYGQDEAVYLECNLSTWHICCQVHLPKKCVHFP